MKTTNKILLISFFAIFVLAFILVMVNLPKEKSLNKEYPNLVQDNVYEKINSEGFLNRVNNKDTFIAVFGFPTCPWCQALLPVLDEVAKEEGIDTVYYIYLKDMRDNELSLEHSNYQKIYKLMKKANAVDEAKGRVNAPTIVVVKDGSIVASHLDTVASQKVVNGSLPPLNAEQKQELVQILKDLINKMK